MPTKRQPDTPTSARRAIARGRMPTKKQLVFSLARSRKGVSVAEIVETLQVTAAAARALIGDLRRDGRNLTTIRGVTTRYKAAGK